jgi:proline iminopeptidase
MVDRYPEIEPYEQGMLDVADGQRMYWEVCGNPDGKPAVVLHGGPGSGCTPGYRRLFNPDASRWRRATTLTLATRTPMSAWPSPGS